MTNFYIHSNDQSLSDNYKNLRLHIALEKSDNDKDWDSFKILYKYNPDFLKGHLNMSKDIFNYNYLNLSVEMQNKLFLIN